MTDIVERLKQPARDRYGLEADTDPTHDVRHEAANEIERLRAALTPFAAASDSYDDEPPARVIASRRGSIVSVCDLRIAKAALG